MDARKLLNLERSIIVLYCLENITFFKPAITSKNQRLVIGITAFLDGFF